MAGDSKLECLKNEMPIKMILLSLFFARLDSYQRINLVQNWIVSLLYWVSYMGKRRASARDSNLGRCDSNQGRATTEPQMILNIENVASDDNELCLVK